MPPAALLLLLSGGVAGWPGSGWTLYLLLEIATVLGAAGKSAQLGLHVWLCVASSVLLWLGAITSVSAAMTALGQSDVKRVIAYSTCSQLDFMAHASFKAALFLRAGSMIHVISSWQDARRYDMPHGIANATGFVLASLSLDSLTRSKQRTRISG
jgi:NADH:ubiquinone oxidoreductase subunit 5 (subunit L)/multisubunit Na+/H+ antiporter MnhA subunit